MERLQQEDTSNPRSNKSIHPASLPNRLEDVARSIPCEDSNIREVLLLQDKNGEKHGAGKKISENEAEERSFPLWNTIGADAPSIAPAHSCSSNECTTRKLILIAQAKDVEESKSWEDPHHWLGLIQEQGSAIEMYPPRAIALNHLFDDGPPPEYAPRRHNVARSFGVTLDLGREITVARRPCTYEELTWIEMSVAVLSKASELAGGSEFAESDQEWLKAAFRTRFKWSLPENWEVMVRSIYQNSLYYKKGYLKLFPEVRAWKHRVTTVRAAVEEFEVRTVKGKQQIKKVSEKTDVLL